MIHLFFYINFVKNHRKLQNVKVKKPNVNEMIIYLERGIRIMKTWNDYKKHVNAVDPEISKDLKKTEEIATIVSAMIKQRNSLGLSQRDLASMCGLSQSSVARIESGKTTPNLGTLLNIFQHLGLTLTVVQTQTI